MRPQNRTAEQVIAEIASDAHGVVTRGQLRAAYSRHEPAGGRAGGRPPLAEHRLTVELDGHRYHHSRHAWEQDRRREREARARGDEFRRYTYGDVVEHPRLMLTELRELFSRCPA